MNPLKWIIAWKFGRAVLSLLAGVSCLVIALSWLDAGASVWAHQLGRHAAGGVWLVQGAEHASLVWIGAAFVADATLAYLEGISLWRGWRWGRWFVIITSLALVPFELAALTQVLSVARIVVLVMNVVIALWLLRHKLSPASGFSRPPEVLPR